MKHAAQDLHCSFCGKSRQQVQRLIAGPQGIFICDQCVQLCNQILAAEAAPKSTRPGSGWRCWVGRLRPGAHVGR